MSLVARVCVCVCVDVGKKECVLHMDVGRKSVYYDKDSAHRSNLLLHLKAPRQIAE